MCLHAHTHLLFGEADEDYEGAESDLPAAASAASNSAIFVEEERKNVGYRLPPTAAVGEADRKFTC